METINVIEQAKARKICDEWHARMVKNPSVENLCKMYFDGDDWAMENDFPSVEVLRKFKGKTESYGLFTDYTGMPNNLKKAAFFGNSDIKMIYNGFSVSQLTLRHNTKATIKAAENAILVINLLDSAELNVECYENARVEIFSYGNEKIKMIGDVKIHKSTLKK